MSNIKTFSLPISHYVVSEAHRPSPAPRRTCRTYPAVTQHSFLTQAGTGTLPLARLALWLAQDCIYTAHAYPRFIGTLISRIPFHVNDKMAGPKERRNERTLALLVKCLENIVRSVDFFRNMAKGWDMDLDEWAQRKATRNYTAEMNRISSGSFDEGLVFLWSMERVHLDAWTYVRQLQSATKVGPDNVCAAAVSNFVLNWTSPDFQAFVQAQGDLVNELPVEERCKAEDVWERVIELEMEFWPNGGEEKTMKVR